MKTIPYLAVFLAFSFLFVSCSDDDDNDTPISRVTGKNQNANPNTHAEYQRLEMPHIKGTSDNLVIIHSTRDFGVNYIVEWDCFKKSQRWTCYTLNKSNSKKNVSRWTASKGESQYPWDPDIPMSATLGFDTYYGSGYDHGHICPSYDRLNSAEANKQTFYMSNMQPQRNVFNAGIWLKMENIVSRTWNLDNFRDTLYICKGGTIDYDDQISVITTNGMIVPKYFFMAVLCKNSQGYKAIAFWVQHLNEDHSNDNLLDYVISINELERLTDIDFFCNLPDDVEEDTERVVFPAAWGLK